MAENDDMRTPRPDPTKLTTDAVNAALDITRRELQALKDLMCQRMDGMDHAESSRYQMMEERFARVERLRIEQKDDAAAAIAAALAAQKEAIGKSEAATKEQIAALGLTATTAYEAVRRDIDDLKSRVTIVEAAKSGANEAREGISSQAGLAIAALGLIVSGVAVLITVVLAANGVL